jgi:cellulose biosynthesis protein BcsQ
MLDLFNFLKELLRNEPELVAAFVMGIIVALVFLSSLLYWFFSKRFGGKLRELEAGRNDAVEKVNDLRGQLQDKQEDHDEWKKKAKERKAKIEEQENELGELKKKAQRASQAAGESKKNEEKTAKEKQNLQKQFDSRQADLKQQIAQLKAKYDKLYAIAQQKIKNYVDQATALRNQINSLNDQAKRIEKLQGQLWDLPVDQAKIPPFRPLKKNCAAIIAVTNLKGGVGKTTLTANIAITYCRQMDKRVLAIDLDFQASLTNICMPVDLVGQLQIGNGRLIDNVFKNIAPGLAKLAFANISQTPEPKFHLLAATEKLANVEEGAKARWLMNQGSSDLRCALRSALHDPVFQDNYDVVLIDCPPRWTTSSINAIACCDYVLIPTQLDRVSSEAVPRLLAWLRDLRSSSAALYGNFHILGIVGNRAYPREALVAQERTIWEALPAKCKDAWRAPVHHFATIIKDKSEFRRAANTREFAALHPDLQPAFLGLVQEIEARRSEHESR